MDSEGEGEVEEGPAAVIRSGNDGQFEFGENPRERIPDADVVIGLGRGSSGVEGRGDPDIRHSVKISRRSLGESVPSPDRHREKEDPGGHEVDDLDASPHKEGSGDECVPVDPCAPSLAEGVGGIGTRNRSRYILTEEIGKFVGQGCRLAERSLQEEGGKENNGQNTP